MNFSNIPDNLLIFLTWVTALGLFISLIEASLIIRFERINSFRKRQQLIDRLYPKNLV